MTVVLKYIVPKGFVAMAIYPFIVLKYDATKTNWVLLNHERIHLRQQLELLIIPFFIIYALEFVIKWLKYRDPILAYRTISFEREAYVNESDFIFLKRRRFWNFIHYF